jgi:omega-6 fatty acid desaturase (delta-12 desaturase)
MDADRLSAVRASMRESGKLRVRNAKGAATVVVELVITSVVLFGLLHVDRWSPAFFALEGLGATSLFRWFVILHECGHRTLFTRTRANSIAGHVASTMCLIPYFPWRDIHLQHHRWVGVIDKDPTQEHLLKLQRIGRVESALFRAMWRLWLPVPFIKFLFEVFWGDALRGRRARSTLRRGWCSNIVCAAPQVVAMILAPGAWAAVFLPMLLGFYLLIENMNLPQHSELFPYLSDSHPRPIPLGEQDSCTRSTHLTNWLSTALALNFNRHTEHHMLPSVPWYALNDVRDELLRSGYRHPHEVPFVSFMHTLRRRDPLVVYRDALPSWQAPTDAAIDLRVERRADRHHEVLDGADR